MSVFDDLKAKLQEMFMFDRADLDFGMYRILNAKRVEVTRFLEKELLPSARAALGSVTAEDQAKLKAAVDTAREQARKFGAPNPDATEAVKDAQAAYKAASDTASIEEDIYSHLLAFFSRYYQEGDFVPQRRYSAAGRERYMIPYDGEEVKLVWANMEQYYIKSSEALTDYAFTFDSSVGKKRVELKLIAATEDNSNNKSQNSERRFALADLTANPVTVSADGATLSIAFTYLEHPKTTKQTDLLSKCEETLAAAAIPEPYKAAIFALDPSFTSKGSRTMLRKHLDVYVAKNTYDYFIHKDIGGFLRRELDYFIKSEVLRIDDLLPEDPIAASRQLKKVRALKGLASQIIAFLEQIENFQKKLWLKKKFVTEVRYCLTLDRIPEEFYEEIAANAAQRAEWEALFAIGEIQKDTAGQVGYPGAGQALTVDFLKSNQHLFVDTLHYSGDFLERLQFRVTNLEATLDGHCFHSENSQAARFVATRYDSSIGVVYIDPPYNTGKGDFMYRDGFKSSTWASMMAERLPLFRALLRSDGLLLSSIGDHELANLVKYAEMAFGHENLISTLVWNNEGNIDNQSRIKTNHEYIIAAAKDESLYPHPEVISPDIEDDSKLFNETIENSITKNGPANPASEVTLPEGFPASFEKGEIPQRTNEWPHLLDDAIVAQNKLIAPCRAYSGWSSRTLLEQFIANGCQAIIDGKGLKTWFKLTHTGAIYVYKKRDKQSHVLSIIRGVSTVKKNSGILADMGFTFSYPKPVDLLQYLCRFTNDTQGIVADFFSGSGTTGHAVIENRRSLNDHRKYLLVEAGDYFDSLIVPRLKKVAYAPNWKDGKPLDRDKGLSHAFKILKLESYEDTLNNLKLPSLTASQTLALENASATTRADYLLHYCLELETKNSPSLLDITQFASPWSYNLRSQRQGETRTVAVDLVETFIWLLGLRVEHKDVRITLAADFEDAAGGRTGVKKGTLRKSTQGWTFQTVIGRDRSDQLHLIIWRSLTDNSVKDNAVLDAFFQKQGYNSRDSEFNTIYVNGDNNLANLSLSAPSTSEETGTYKVKLIESEFHRLMWDVRDI